MGKGRQVTLAVLFGAFTGILAMVVQLMALALMGTSVTGEALVSAASGGAVVCMVSALTVLFVWPRIGFVPFDAHPRKPS
jgi:hypothetical protein